MRLDIAQEHLEEAEFLFAFRVRALRSELFDLRRLAELEERLDAHLDGLAWAAEEGWPGLVEGLRADEPGTVAAAVGGLALGGKSQQLVSELRALDAGRLVGAQAALRYVPIDGTVENFLNEVLRDSASSLVALALDALSANMKLTPVQLKPFVRAETPEVLGAAARATSRIGGDLDWLEPLTHHDAATVRSSALSAMLRRGAPAAKERCRELAADSILVTPEVVRMMGAIALEGDLPLLRQLAGVGPLADSATAALAALGTTECVGVLLDLMGDPASARGAGAAFPRITGIAPVRLDGTPQSVAEEDIAFDDTRPVPDALPTRSRWDAVATQYKPAVRYRGGAPLESKRWSAEPNGGDLATRWEELLRLWSDGSSLYAGLDLEAPVKRQIGTTKGAAL